MISYGVLVKTPPSLANCWPVPDDGQGHPGFRECERLVVLDDLLNVAYSREVCDLFIKDSHHRDISVILITQKLFHQGRFNRDISLNAKHLVVFKNVRDKNQFAYLA